MRAAIDSDEIQNYLISLAEEAARLSRLSGNPAAEAHFLGAREALFEVCYGVSGEPAGSKPLPH